jgi:hypothetical protein
LRIGHDAPVSTTEADRHHLYTGLVELLGEHRAGTLMTYLPSYDPSTVATRADLAATRADLAEVKAGIAALANRFDGFDKRLDRLFLTLVAGLFVIVAAMAGVVASSLG